MMRNQFLEPSADGASDSAARLTQRMGGGSLPDR